MGGTSALCLLYTVEPGEQKVGIGWRAPVSLAGHCNKSRAYTLYWAPANTNINYVEAGLLGLQFSYSLHNKCSQEKPSVHLDLPQN